MNNSDIFKGKEETNWDLWGFEQLVTNGRSVNLERDVSGVELSESEDEYELAKVSKSIQALFALDLTVVAKYSGKFHF